MAAAAELRRARAGRPPRLDDAGTATRERLLAAAVDACVEHGYDGATLGDIARRSGVSAPAIYNHFGGKEELLVAAGRWSLDRMSADVRGPVDAGSMVRAFLHDTFADSRRLLTELHLAGRRRPEVAALLAEWHAEHAAAWSQRATGTDPAVDVTTFFALLLGLCQVESLRTIGAPTGDVAERAAGLADALFHTRSEENRR